MDATGFVGGVQGGCNYQTGPIVFGVQGDYLWANARGSNDNPVIPARSDRSRVKSLGSVTGRVDYAWDRFLGYVKGGGAWQRTEYEFFIPATSGTPSGARETHAGWTLGIGAEYTFLPNVTAFIEYDYYDFGTRSTQFITVVSVLHRMADIRERSSVVKDGVNFKFDLGAAAFNFDPTTFGGARPLPKDMSNFVRAASFPPNAAVAPRNLCNNVTLLTNYSPKSS